MIVRPRWLLAVAMLAVVGCPDGTDSPAPSNGRAWQAIVDGALAPDDLAVVALVGRRTRCEGEELTVLCTGTLIAPRVVLTAAHCLDLFGPDGQYEVLFGPRVGGDGPFSLVVAAQVHPGYDRATHENDLALLRLAEPAPVSPHALPDMVRAGVPSVGQAVRAVGFGQTRDPAEPSGHKRQGTMAISEVTPTAFRTVPSPAMTCVGDSGGPVFATVDGRELLYAVTASGDFGCRNHAFNVRVDVALDDFIRPFLRATEEMPVGVGDGALALPALCTAPCVESSDCPAGLRCVTAGSERSRCVLAGLGEGAFGDECATDGQCGSRRCARLLPEGPGACRCFTPCGQPGLQPGSGCSAAGSGRWSPASLALAFVALGWRRRGRTAAARATGSGTGGG